MRVFQVMRTGIALVLVILPIFVTTTTAPSTLANENIAATVTTATPPMTGSCGVSAKHLNGAKTW